MAMTTLGLGLLLIPAILLSAGLFVTFNDGGKTNAVLGFVGAAFWLLLGVSALSVRMVDGTNSIVTRPMWPVVYAGVGMGVAVTVFALLSLYEAVENQTPGTVTEDLF
jgi:hypothetical protein